MAPYLTSTQRAKFNKVDNWINSSLLPPDTGLTSALEANAASNLDDIDVAPNQGKFLYLLAKMNHCKRILEVGTLGGYSAIWFAKAVPSDGKVVTLELEPEHARVARANIAHAGFGNIVEVKVGPALESLENMGKEGTEAFDMVFIDADKENNVGYLKWALEFSHVGTVIVVDNVVRQGRVIDEGNEEPGVVGVRNLFEVMKGEKRLECTAVQTVGSKGWDGFAMALVVK
jgi:predicted O-methyltransferase YrrM